MEILNTILKWGGPGLICIVLLLLVLAIIGMMAESSTFISKIPQGYARIYIDQNGTFKIFVINDSDSVVDKRTGIIFPRTSETGKKIGDPWRVPILGYFFVSPNFTLKPFKAGLQYVSTESVPATDGKPAQLLDKTRTIGTDLPLEESIRIWATSLETKIAGDDNSLQPGSLKADMGLLVFVRMKNLRTLYGKRDIKSSPWTNTLDEITQATVRSIVTGMMFTAVQTSVRINDEGSDALEKDIREELVERLKEQWPDEPLEIISVQITGINESADNDKETLDAYKRSQTIKATLAQNLIVSENELQIARNKAKAQAAELNAIIESLGGDANPNARVLANQIVLARLQAQSIEKTNLTTLVLGSTNTGLTISDEKEKKDKGSK